MLILSYIFLVSTLVFLVFRAAIWLAFYLHKSNEKKGAPPISWIICAKNEAELLSKNLDHWLKQEYHDWELIIVLDQCTDNSADIVLAKIKEHPHLKYVENLDSTFPGKRNALIAGAEYAAHEHILLSDADCMPLSLHWIKIMAGQFDDKTDFVIGFSPYEKQAGFLNLIIRLETFFTASLYGASAILGSPYMAVGRNLGLKKKYLSSKYFAGQTSISGDDDLLVNRYANGKNTKVCIENESLVESIPKRTWSDFLNQKTRHASAGKHYTFSSRFFLLVYYLFHILFYATGIVIPFVFGVNHYLFYIFAIALLFNLFMLIGIKRKLEFNLNGWELLFGDFCLSFFLISLGILSRRRQVRKW